MSITPVNTTQAKKQAWLVAKLATLLNAHGYATFNVHQFITKNMLGMESDYVF